MRIGVFDSGIGGLSVLKYLIDSKFFDEIIYYGDTARVPYGNKDKETIKRFCLEALDFFSTFKIDMLIVACNTASAYSIEIMQSNAPYPIVGVIDAGVLSLSNKIKDKNKQILIIGTKATITSNLYAVKLKEIGYNNVLSLQTGLFVPLVEEGVFSGELLDSTMRYYFSPLLESNAANQKKIDSSFKAISSAESVFETNAPSAIILGCTHFPLIKKEIARFFNNKPVLIHSGEAIVEYLQIKYNLKPKDINEVKVSYYASDNVESLKRIANIWLSS